MTKTVPVHVTNNQHDHRHHRTRANNNYTHIPAADLPAFKLYEKNKRDMFQQRNPNMNSEQLSQYVQAMFCEMPPAEKYYWQVSVKEEDDTGTSTQSTDANVNANGNANASNANASSNEWDIEPIEVDYGSDDLKEVESHEEQSPQNYNSHNNKQKQRIHTTGTHTHTHTNTHSHIHPANKKQKQSQVQSSPVGVATCTLQERFLHTTDCVCSGKPSNSSSSSSRRRKNRDPNAPKRNLSAYLLYQHYMQKVMKDDPNITFGDIAKYTSEKYKSLTPTDKAYWDANAEEDRIRYHQQLANYTPPPGYDKYGNLHKNGAEGGKKKKKKKTSKKNADSPKRAMGPYVFFANEVRPKLWGEQPHLKFIEIGKKLGEKWRAMTPRDRAPYEQMAAVDKARYEREMKDYKNKERKLSMDLLSSNPEEDDSHGQEDEEHDGKRFADITPVRL